MAFERDVNSEVIKYADKHFPKCPFCQTNIPDWSVEVTTLSSRSKRYVFLCHECEGTFEIKTTSSNAFKNNTFSEVIMGNVGRGQYNYRMRGKETDIAELCDMCGYDINEDVEPEIEETVETSSSLSGRSDFGFGGFVEEPREDITRSDVTRSDVTRRRTTSSSSSSSSSDTTRRSTTTSYSGSSSSSRTTTTSTSRTTTSRSSSSYRGSSSRSKPKRPFGFIGIGLAGFAFFLQFIGFITSTSGNSENGKSFLGMAVVASIPAFIFSIIGRTKSSNYVSSIFGIIISILTFVLSVVLIICYA